MENGRPACPCAARTSKGESEGGRGGGFMSSGADNHKHPPLHDFGRRPQLESRVERLHTHTPRLAAKPRVSKDRRAARTANTSNDAQRSSRNRQLGDPQ
jgi:hypothetical protein